MSFYYGSSANRKLFNQKVRPKKRTVKQEVNSVPQKQGWFKRMFNKLFNL